MIAHPRDCMLAHGAAMANKRAPGHNDCSISGTINERMSRDVLAEAERLAQARNAPLSIAHLHLHWDNMGSIQTTRLGHEKDIIVSTLVCSARKSIERDDDCVRLAEDAFLIVFPGVSEHGTMHLINAILRRAVRNSSRYVSLALRASITAGIARKLVGENVFEALLRADIATRQERGHHFKSYKIVVAQANAKT